MTERATIVSLRSERLVRCRGLAAVSSVLALLAACSLEDGGSSEEDGPSAGTNGEPRGGTAAGTGQSSAGTGGTSRGDGGRDGSGAAGRSGTDGAPSSAGMNSSETGGAGASSAGGSATGGSSPGTGGSTDGACSLTLPDGDVPVCCAPNGEQREQVDEVFRLLNEHRQANGVAPLEYDLMLEAAIQGHCRHMVEAGFFDHTAPVSEVASPWTRAGLCGSEANAENIARGQSSAAKVMDTWKNSSGHNKNMLNESYKRVGIGMHDNRWGQLFGR